MWKVADADTTIYLFGTVHILPKGIDWFTGTIAESFAQSDELVTEVAEASGAAKRTLVAEMAVLPEEQTLRELLGDERKAQYERAIAALGLPVNVFDRYEIWYTAMGMALMPVMQEGYAADHGVEKLLETNAKERGIAHEGLETAEYQLGLFDGLPIDAQKRYLDEIIEQLPTLREDLKTMVEAWKTGDSSTLAQIINDQTSDPELREMLLVARNRAWAEWIAERLDQPGTVFLAVGAGHLAGAGSLQDQLLGEGIATERLQ